MEKEKRVEANISENEALAAEEQDLREALVTPSGIVGEKYEGELPIPEQQEETASEFEDKEHIDLWYDFTKEEVAEAMRIFQRKTIFKKYLFYSILVGALFLVELSRMAVGNSEKSSMMVCVVCVAVFVMIWMMPRNQIRQVQKALDTYEEPPQYFISIYPGAVRTGTGDHAAFFRFDTENIRVFENDTQFILSIQNRSLFPIPKRCIESEEQTDTIRRYFADTLGDKYERI